MKKASFLNNSLASAILATVITALASVIVYELDVPNPVIVLVVVMIFFSALCKPVAGAVSGICIIFYSLYFFSVDHSFIRFTHEDGYKCNVIVVSLCAIYLLVAWIRKREKRFIKRIETLNDQLEQQNASLKKESDLDALTGIYNRRGGDQRASYLLEKGIKIHQESFRALVSAVDIDDFKEINDAYGHEAGDQALQCLTSSLQSTFPHHSVLIRNGGDEFQIFLYGQNIEDLKKEMDDFVHQSFSFQFHDQTINFEISGGCAVYPDHASTLKELYRKADLALYQAKINGRHQAVTYQTDEPENIRTQFSIRSVAENLPVCFFVYQADESQKILVISDSLLQLCECENYREFLDYSGGTFRSIIHPDDREYVEKTICKQIASNKNGLDEVDYRIITKNGNIRHIHDLGRLVKGTRKGDVFYVVVYDREILESEVKMMEQEVS
ncbi:MAG: diguanylate cyclase [Erysipelotrichaceae bacterium]|nr:diguanylate cyclase [Erysipelotrichaceae bacterium]